MADDAVLASKKGDDEIVDGVVGRFGRILKSEAKVSPEVEEEVRLEFVKRVKEEREKEKLGFKERLLHLLRGRVEEVPAYDPEVHGPLVSFQGLPGFVEVEGYWVNEPYALVTVLKNVDGNEYLYHVSEPELTPFENILLEEIKERLRDTLLTTEEDEEGVDKGEILTSKVRLLIKEYSINLTPPSLEKILYYTRRDFIDYGKIDPLLHDDKLEDISANGYGIPIYLYHKEYQNIPTNIVFSEDELNAFIIRLAQRCGKHISTAEPLVDATMPDGSRVQLSLGKEVTSRGGTFTIRKFHEIPITPVDLIVWNTFSAEEMAYLWLCIENNKSIIFAGGTASGKTSSLNAVSLFIPPQAKIISLEDTRELKLPHPNWIPAVTRDSFTSDEKGAIDMYELLRAALRQRPEYLLVGEVRGKEALTLFQAMSTGHTTFSTMHADSVAGAIHRLENPPISVPRSMLAALNIMCIQAQIQIHGKRVRRNTRIVEITDIDPVTRNIKTNEIFIWDGLTDSFHHVGESKALMEIAAQRGWNHSDLEQELKYRQQILEYMVKQDIRDYRKIANIIHEYELNPEKTLERLEIKQSQQA